MPPASHAAPAKAPPKKGGAKAVAITIAKAAAGAATLTFLQWLNNRFPFMHGQ